MKIVITDDRFGWNDEELRVFGDFFVPGRGGAELVTANCHTEQDLISACSGADAILLNQAPMTARVIATLDRCQVISRYGIGYDNVDIKAASEAGIWVTNVPGYCTDEVAEHALGLLLSCVRAIPARNALVKQGGWNLNLPVRRMAGGILGIVGFGATGRAFWEKARGFAFSRVLVADPRAKAKIAGYRAGEKTEAASFDELIRRSDFISFHVPLNEATRRCVNKKTLGRMKDGVILVNTARGAVIDEQALAKALESGKVAAAGLDVFESEPLRADHPFFNLPNVVLSDHSAYYSRESVSELKTRTALNAREVLEGRIPRTPVNRPGDVGENRVRGEILEAKEGTA
ncbi:MAG: C-terminal binding protein [Treponema sp.]|nr:C-terminal binding protein [Treponema sp.]